jgi:hypothetical protein
MNDKPDNIIRSFTTPKPLLDEVRDLSPRLNVSVNAAHVEGLQLWVKKYRKKLERNISNSE